MTAGSIGARLSLVALVAACSGADGTAPPGSNAAQTASIRLSAVADTVVIGTNRRLSATALDAAGNPLINATIAWRSSDATRATVTSDGSVTAIAPGLVQVIAESGGKTAAVALVVSPNPADALDVLESQGCAANVAGRVFCWGSNTRGQLGSGCPTSFCAEPVAAPDTIPAIGVAVTYVSACALHADGSVFCWGNPGLGTLGGASATSTSSRVQLPAGVRLARIAAGMLHICGATGDGVAYCWGRNDGGQLGAVSGEQCTLPGLVLNPTPCSTTPIRVSGTQLFYRIGSGYQHSCGLATTGQTYCWGSRNDGALGDGTANASTTTTPVVVSGGHPFIVLGVGSRNTCATQFGVGTYCWGASIGGQMADGLLPDADIKYAEPRLTYAPAFTSIYGSRSNSIFAPICGIDASSAAWCWGDNTDGQLGVANGRACPGYAPNICSPMPAAIPGFKALSIVPGVHHTCAISDDRHLYCWGRNDVGQLGDGTTTSSRTRVQVKGFVAPGASH